MTKNFIQENLKDNEVLIITKPIEISFSDLSKQYGIRVLFILLLIYYYCLYIYYQDCLIINFI